MKVKCKCKFCSRIFSIKPSWVKLGNGKYCSLACKYKGSRLGKDLPCFICGKVVYHPKGRIARVKSNKFFCSKSCQTIWRNSYYVGSKHGNYKDGNSMYRSILTHSKVLAVCKLCKNKDKRVLAVHHLDRQRSNNKVENLLWLCHNCHHLVHHYNIEV